jgi:hypothetical protein
MQEVKYKMNVTLYNKGHIWQVNLCSSEKFNAFHLDLEEDKDALFHNFTSTQYGKKSMLKHGQKKEVKCI